MRIEAQGKYLQKIIEEQQKIGGALKASEAVPSVDDKDKPSQLKPMEPPEASTGPLSPRKKQKVGDAPKPDPKHGFINQWDGDMYGNDGVFGFNLEMEFKGQEEGGGSEQRAGLELEPVGASK